MAVPPLSKIGLLERRAAEGNRYGEAGGRHSPSLKVYRSPGERGEAALLIRWNGTKDTLPGRIWWKSGGSVWQRNMREPFPAKQNKAKKSRAKKHGFFIFI